LACAIGLIAKPVVLLAGVQARWFEKRGQRRPLFDLRDQDDRKRPWGINLMRSSNILRAVAALGALLASTAVLANPVPWQVNLTQGVTDESHAIFKLHMAAFWVCVAIGIVVFGAMIIAMFRFRKSRGAVAANWSHNTKLEVLWTLIPVLILIGLATPATMMVRKMYDSTGSDMTIKVTGYQWKWRYDYVSYEGKPVNKVGYMSKLAADSNRIRQTGSGLDPESISDHGFKDYLLDVDKPLVIPAGMKVRFVVTGGDVIHGFWIPPFGIKKDAIPGIINDVWVKVDKPGTYRGQCHVLCGQDHGFMPIVVNVLPKAQFESWLAAQESKAALDKAAHTAGAVTPATNVVAQH
jgi:cytochrome c oxidase subunit 2